MRRLPENKKSWLAKIVPSHSSPNHPNEQVRSLRAPRQVCLCVPSEGHAAVAGEQEKLAGEDCSFPPIAQSPQRASALVGDPDGAMNGAPTSFVAGRDNRQQQKRMRGFFASELSVENLSGCGYSAGDVDGAVFFLVFFGRWV